MKKLRLLVLCGILALAVPASSAAAFAAGRPAVAAAQAAETAEDTASAEAAEAVSETSEEHEETAAERAARTRQKMFAPENFGWLLLVLVVSFVLTYLEQYFKEKRNRNKF